MDKDLEYAAQFDELQTESHSIGNGQWSVEVIGITRVFPGDTFSDGSVNESSYFHEEKFVVKEFVGNNGTWEGEEADDLHSLASEFMSQVEDWQKANPQPEVQVEIPEASMPDSSDRVRRRNR